MQIGFGLFSQVIPHFVIERFVHRRDEDIWTLCLLRFKMD
jgi:hypothetical protein